MSDVFQQFVDRLSRGKRVLITTHVRPDGDAIGTTAALSLAMKKKGIESEVLLLSHLPTKYGFIFRENNIACQDVEKSWPDKFPFERFDTLLVTDTGTWSQLPGLKERIADWRVPKLVLDHHLTQEDWADVRLVITQAAAAGEIAFELIERWGVQIDSAIATALFVAIASDTGWFQFSNTRPFTHRTAASLIEKGVDTDRVYQLLYQNERPQRVALQTRAMQSLELLANDRLAVMRISRDDFHQTHAHVPDTENLINIPLQIRTIEVVALITETPEPGPIRISLRSKGGLDCARFAEQFGGGGHARAAGLKLETTFTEAHDQVVKALLAALK
ncbi:MAG TPA: DHH family phosphoesterase [Tepidisphaeraceae bacterium]|nr:DHH family phosphoesterase [Tepidisphaeraceae bacterium]